MWTASDVRRATKGERGARLRALLLAGLIIVLTACDDEPKPAAQDAPRSPAGGSGYAQPPRTLWAPAGSPPVPVSIVGVTDPDTAVQAFLTHPVTGDKPFRTVKEYLDWLGSRPGTRAVDIRAAPSGEHGWSMHVTVVAEDGREQEASCPFGTESPFNRTGVLWGACPELAGLWTVFAPTVFDSLAGAALYLPRATVVVFLPNPPPGTFTLRRIELPAAGDEAARHPFVITAIYVDEAGTTVRLAQQTAGLNIGIFPAWQQCTFHGQRVSGACIAWASMSASFLLASDTASAEVLHQFERAIDPRR
jgi:hypothetical protein